MRDKDFAMFIFVMFLIMMLLEMRELFFLLP
jgi:hypothetical protein